ncbi:hypothetical protein Bca101_009412 [Brassica carinata]
MANSYTLLANLRAGRCSNTAEVSLLRFWEARNINRGGELMSLEMLLIDEAVSDLIKIVLDSWGFTNVFEVSCEGERTSCRRDDASSDLRDIDPVKNEAIRSKSVGAELQTVQEFNPAVSWIPKGAPKVMPDDAEPHSKEKINELSRMAPSRKDGVIFHGKSSPRSYSKGYLPSHASHVSADQRERLAMFLERLDQSRDITREIRKTMMEAEDLGVSALHDLSRHRQTLLHSHSKLHGVDEDEVFKAISLPLCRSWCDFPHCYVSVYGPPHLLCLPLQLWDLSSPSKEIARMIKQKLVETEHSSLSGAVPDFDGRKNIYSPVEFQKDRLELFAYLPISSCNTLIKCVTCVRSYLRR